MKTYEITIEGKNYYFKSEADSEQINNAIEFIRTTEVSFEKFLQAVRLLGFKTTPITLDPVDIFEV
jgi:hypothetical protein